MGLARTRGSLARPATGWANGRTATDRTEDRMGELLIDWTIRLSLLAWWAASVLTVLRHGRGWPATHRTARTLWTGGVVLFVAHVLAAFHFVHGWSHAAAVEQTAQEVASHPWLGFRFGAGVYVNETFGVVWLADVVWWWVAPASRDRRPAALTAALHALFVVMVFSGAVVFERGTVRWVTLAGLLTLGSVTGWSHRGRIQAHR